MTTGLAWPTASVYSLGVSSVTANSLYRMLSTSLWTEGAAVVGVLARLVGFGVSPDCPPPPQPQSSNADPRRTRRTTVHCLLRPDIMSLPKENAPPCRV